MRVKDLISELEYYDEDADVRLMIQSNYPFQNSITRVASLEEIFADVEDDNDNVEYEDFNGPVALNTVYIVEGNQLGYGYKSAWGEW